MKLATILSALAAIGMFVVLSFGSSAIASDAADPCAGTPPADWGPLKDQGKEENVLGGETSVSGTATVKNNGPGDITVTTSSGGSVSVPSGKTRHIQVPKGDKVDIEDDHDLDDHGSSGTVVFTPNCDDDEKPKDAGGAMPV